MPKNEFEEEEDEKEEDEEDDVNIDEMILEKKKYLRWKNAGID